MKQSNYEMLCVVCSNLISAKEIISDAKFERLSKSMLEDSIAKAIVLIESSLEALKENKDNLFE